MSAATIADAERHDLADLFLRLGPDEPTLCGGWTDPRPVAHLVVRERRPDAAPGILIPPLRSGPSACRTGGRARDFGDLSPLRSGAAAVDPLALPPLRAVDVQEYFVHHEDVRRAQAGWSPRPPDAGATACCGGWPASRAPEPPLAARRRPSTLLPRPLRRAGRRRDVRRAPAATRASSPGSRVSCAARDGRSLEGHDRARPRPAAQPARPPRRRPLGASPAVPRPAGTPGHPRPPRLPARPVGADRPRRPPRLHPGDRPSPRPLTPRPRPARSPRPRPPARRRPSRAADGRPAPAADRPARAGAPAAAGDLDTLRCARGSDARRAAARWPSGAPARRRLGGIGEIGRNMTVLEYGGRLLIVDCGVLFPSEDSPGVDLILPDFRAIEDRLDDVDALVLTHGHEDHIGAVPFLLRQKPDLLSRRLAVHARAGRREVHGAPPHPAPARGPRGRAQPLRLVRLRVLRGQPLDPRRARRRDPHAGRHGAAHRRHQARPAARSTAG